MSFSPVLPLTGSAGWAFLKRTETAQRAALAKTPEMQRDADYFRERIGKIDTAEDLVADRRLLRISLQAFGLEGDVENRAFLKKMLEEGTLKEGALALKLTDPRYRAFTQAFGFDLAVPRSKLSDFPDKILAQWQDRRFEAAVGAQDGDMRLAIATRRDLAALAAGKGTETAKWLRVIGSAPLRKVMQQALGLPASLGKIDLDAQVGLFRDKAAAMFGADTVSQFTDPKKTEELIRRFLLRSEIPAVSPQTGVLAALEQVRGMMRRI